ncbi:hypothetical protein FNW52_12410 [Flavobacterium sp. ZT3R18]|uniref:hypothetical protein n=1 Tax=Flavobacterium sp. ZT3R18 TaxID=2594429 RepID=UPI00117A22E3|nr:hypothetical protein [Flavobacterium sp. ZT3R18]TRX34938.1 hypothetical protein FNW52_12410 [Flavobacterium sp. ZT3R18]
MKTDFVIADEHGRELFKEYATKQDWYKYIKESKNEKARWDISYWSGSTMIIGEIKVRESYDSTSFVEWDYEAKKHTALVELKDQMQEKYPKKTIEIQYINIFKDEAIKIWTTTNIHNQQQPVWNKRPSTTYGKTEMVDKLNYKCSLENEALRSHLYEVISEPRIEDGEDENDNLPF